MRRRVASSRVLHAIVVALLLALFLVPSVSAQGSYTVSPGETLTSIAQQYGLSAQELAAANGLQLHGWIYVGQQLQIPPIGTTTPSVPASNGNYLIRSGDTLSAIAMLHGTTVQALMEANNLTSALIYAGQRLSIPSATVTPPSTTQPASSGEKWIDVNLTTQTITAYEGDVAVYSAIVSTGLPATPTVVGRFPIYVKHRFTDMAGGSYAAGDYYYLRDVPFTMYFFRGYGIHGTYWHDNFGQPMSHGCVNLRTSDAEWFFNWAEVGTMVVTHH